MVLIVILDRAVPALTLIQLLRIRLQRIGRKHQPLYRIVVAEHARAVKRKPVEIIGNYDAQVRPHAFSINKSKYDKWIKLGAKPTVSVERLVTRAELEVRKTG
jgi:small subunit ribosomal protein S16